ncbi:MAG: nitrous oxide-stimulated promoter family protein [Dethiobacter sp.]|jgi:predicted amidophosphoribosyltransferase|nr:nitrous oxide-stimulated promoter family protein [Dethiobacter sp.]
MAAKNSLHRERDTIEKMIRLYCRSKHHPEQALCRECRDLFSYASERLGKCRFGSKKPTCGQCTVHCYKPAMREKVRMVMRYAGPRMIFTHPVDAIRHLIQTRRPPAQ